MALSNGPEEANDLCASMLDLAIKTFLRNVLIYSVKLSMEELSAVSATEILLVKGNKEFGKHFYA